MKYTIYFIFFAFIALLLFFFKSALEPKETPPALIGSGKCGECHVLRSLGDQQTVWEKSRHKNAYLTLQTEKAVSFASKNNIEQPVKNSLCLKCHTTEFSIKDISKTPTYNITEGVGCESCHGPGSNYYPADMHKVHSEFLRNGGVKTDESTCRNCHSPKGNPDQKILETACPFQEQDFIYLSAFEKIKHSLNKESF